ncbi:cell division protein ZipA [uncultured Ferrimonas sp.]|uniref:cell division protein ZipA n=1 Tax=uncultured Ferrimonas sp. TaxID=432640 RepID=UPI00262A9381|nr:cell division protein ZipA [uncultured Ferrimonas sp.]
MRIVFLVVGSIAITALMIHGFYTVQKKKPKAQNRRTPAVKAKKAAPRVAPELDDEPELSPIRAVEPEQPQPAQPSLLQDDIAPIPEPKAKPARSRSAVRREPVMDSEQIELGLEADAGALESSLTSAQPSQSEVAAPMATAEPLLASAEPQPEVAVIAPEPAPVLATSAPTEPQFSAAAPAQENNPVAADVASADPAEVDAVAEPTDVLVLYVVGQANSDIRGEELLPNLTSMGFKFGEMDIFHRHQHSAGTGPVLYSLANMLQPGTFDLDNMEQFSSEGVLLFLTLPTNNDARVAFSMMLGNAQGLADMHGGQVLDDQRQPWSEMARDNYLQRIQTAENAVNA